MMISSPCLLLSKLAGHITQMEISISLADSRGEGITKGKLYKTSSTAGVIKGYLL